MKKAVIAFLCGAFVAALIAMYPKMQTMPAYSFHPKPCLGDATYVSMRGYDGNDGCPDWPKRTIEAAINAAVSGGATTLYFGEGNFDAIGPLEKPVSLIGESK